MNEVYFPDRTCVNCGNPIPKPNPETSFITLDMWLKKKYCKCRCRDIANERKKIKTRRSKLIPTNSFYYKYIHGIKF